ncbi:Protein FAR1-RELATED SEQUENCE 12 [Glycine max]|nr:Protein FAR1-RELATED SEQUENCE 12 [Glycine max]
MLERVRANGGTAQMPSQHVPPRQFEWRYGPCPAAVNGGIHGFAPSAVSQEHKIVAFMDFVVVDSDNGNEAEHSCLEESTSIFEGVEVQEPYVGMEFDSEEDAREFYVDYARRIGFVVR